MATIRIDVQDLLGFHAVATLGSYTKAAESLGVSKAMLSRQVQRLESQLKQKLLQRTTRKLSVTESGTTLLQYTHRIQDLSQEAGNVLRSMEASFEPRIRISMPISFGEAFAASFVKALPRELSQVRWDFELSNESRDFLGDQIDFAIRASEDHHPDVIAKFLGRLKDVICVSPAMMNHDQARVMQPQDLKKLPCVLHELDDEWNTWALQSRDKDLKIKVSGKVSSNQYSAIRELCISGLGIARMPYYLVSNDIQEGKLLPLLSEYAIATHPLYLVYIKNEYASKIQKAARESILSWFRSHSNIFIAT